MSALTKESINAYLEQLREAGASASHLARCKSIGENTLLYSPMEKFQGQLSPTARLDTLNMRKWMAENRSVTENKPGAYYAINHIKSAESSLPPMVIGAAEAMQASFDRDSAMRWTLDVLITLAPANRLRMLGVHVFSPYTKPMNMDEFRNFSTLSESKKERKKYGSKVESIGVMVLEEHDRILHGIKDHDLLPDVTGADEGFRGLLRTVDGAYRQIMDMADSAYESGQCVDPLIRIIYDRGIGITFSRRHMDEAFYADIIRAWMRDIVDSTQGDRRWVYYTPSTGKYTYNMRIWEQEKQRIASGRTLRNVMMAGLE